MLSDRVGAPVALAKTLPRRRTLPVLTAQAAAKKLQRTKDGVAGALDVEASHGTPFLFVPVFMGAGTAAYFLHASEPPMAPILFALALLFFIWRYRLSHGKRAWIAGAMLCVASGVFLAKIETLRVQSVMLGGGVTTTIDMRVLRVDRDGKRLRLLGQVLATRAPELKYQPECVRISMPASRHDFAAGDVISGRFGLRPPGGPVRPGSYDFAFHAYFAGVGASGFPMGSISKADAPAPSGLAAVRFRLENLRAGIADKVRVVIPGTSGNVSAALIAGVTGGIDEVNEEALRVTGLAHVLSISGLHMALVAGAVLFIVRVGFALFPAFASRYPVKKWAAGAALGASFFYLLLSGGAVATVRSFLMLAVMLGAVMLDRQALTLRNLAIAAILILVVTPHEIMGPSFQMSFAATAALISAYGWISRRRENNPSQGNTGHWPMIRNVVLAAVLTPVVAGLATAIFSAWHFHRLAPMGLPANLAAMPVISFIIMPFAMIGTMAMPFGLEEWPLKIMGYGVDAMLWIARWCADLSPPDTPGALAPATFICLMLALLIITLCQSRIRFAALALVPAAALFAYQETRPDVFISEDARLVAIAASDGALAVNRERPNAFTTQVWRNAAAANIVVKPKIANKAEQTSLQTGDAAAAAGDSAATADTPDSEVSVMALAAAAKASPGQFICGQGACLGWVGGRAMVAWLDPSAFTVSGPAAGKVGTTNGRRSTIPETTKRESIAVDRQFAKLFFQACAATDLVITASAVPYRGCGKGKAQLIRASDLARKGAVEIRFADAGARAGNGSAFTHANAATDAPSASSDSNSLKPDIIERDEEDNRENSTKTSESSARSDKENTQTSSRSEVPAGFIVQYAVGEPSRPWNRERTFSRAARNIPEYQRGTNQPKREASTSNPVAKSAPDADAGTADE